MLNVVEAFSGIGSQAKALKNIKVEHDIVATIEWDLNAIYAYDIIHNGEQDFSDYMNLDKDMLINRLMEYTLSTDGKKPLNYNTLKMMNADALRRFVIAIERTNNLVNITDVKAIDLPMNVDLLTYSFPCQDLSICGSWHGNMTGIDRNVQNRSGMLWEIERILKEYVKIGRMLPKFLLMENVSNILSETHKSNFDEWSSYLESIGYINKVYTLNAIDYGIPQKRIRTYMLSVYTEDTITKDNINQYFIENDLSKLRPVKLQPLVNFLRTDYNDKRYKYEADISNPNFTPSRQKIFRQNEIVYDGRQATRDAIRTITTKQDRNPNSGLLMYCGNNNQKSPYRNLTPRECFLLMGFEESDYQVLIDNDFYIKKGHNFCTREKLIKLAGNSIVVNVLEVIFKQVIYIKDHMLYKKENYEAC